MGVYVKDMKMPDGCVACRMHRGCPAQIKAIQNPKCKDWMPYNYRLDDCPLIEIPTPHGRLIDADAYEKLLRGLGNRDYRREAGTLQDAIKFLHPHYAPTIIPAEEGEDGH